MLRFKRFSNPGREEEGSSHFIQKLKKFLKENFSSLILPLVAILVLIGGIYLYSTRRAVPTLEELVTEEAAKPEITATPTPGVTTQPQEKPEEKKEERVETFKLRAEKGQGITHLARNALKQFLTEDPQGKDFKQKLSPEHRIFIEDFMKDRTGSRFLKVGEELQFSKDLIKEAINSSLKLTPRQLENLKQFSAKVLSFNLNY